MPRSIPQAFFFAAATFMAAFAAECSQCHDYDQASSSLMQIWSMRDVSDAPSGPEDAKVLAVEHPTPLEEPPTLLEEELARQEEVDARHSQVSSSEVQKELPMSDMLRNIEEAEIVSHPEGFGAAIQVGRILKKKSGPAVHPIMAVSLIGIGIVSLGVFVLALRGGQDDNDVDASGSACASDRSLGATSSQKRPLARRGAPQAAPYTYRAPTLGSERTSAVAKSPLLPPNEPKAAAYTYQAPRLVSERISAVAKSPLLFSGRSGNRGSGSRSPPLIRSPRSPRARSPRAGALPRMGSNRSFSGLSEGSAPTPEQVADTRPPWPPRVGGSAVLKAPPPAVPAFGAGAQASTAPRSSGMQMQSACILGAACLSTTSLKGSTSPRHWKNAEGTSISPFCPSLVVPQDSECILVIPMHSIASGGSLNIGDGSGNMVLRVISQSVQEGMGTRPGTVEFFNVGSPAGSSNLALGGRGTPPQVHKSPPQTGVFRSLVLTDSSGTVLAQSCAAASSGGRHAPSNPQGPPEFHLLSAKGEFYAKLVCGEAQDTYVLDTLGGMRLHFWGWFEDHAVNVTDDEGCLLATTESCPDQGADSDTGSDAGSSYYQLRVGPLTDVGLILCGLLSLDHLVESQSQ